MASWSVKRKVTYIGILSGFVVFVIVVPLFFILYKAPTCFDGKQNGDENGSDCGGSCQLLCIFDAKEPDILWSRSFKVTPSIYSSVAYIQNFNITSQAIDVRYVFKLYDNQNKLVATREGFAFIPRNKKFAIFEPNIVVGESVPTRTVFEFTEVPQWIKNNEEIPRLSVNAKSLSREDALPRIDANVQNLSLIPFSNIEIVAIVYDGKDNAIGASRTYIDKLEKDQSADVVFTWPAPFDTQQSVCKVPADVMMVIDRSGSMASDGASPPQPLTDVKNAAILFVNQLGEFDKVGLVSYADTASSPIDAFLSKDFKKVKDSIGAVSIGIDGLQQTNIADGLLKALGEFSSERYNTSARKIIVALTDGVPTRPLKVGDETFPETEALRIATETKTSGTQIYTVGLGSNINENLLKNIASTPDHYFSVLSSKNLGSIYKEIAISICKDSPTTIEIIPLVQKGLR